MWCGSGTSSVAAVDHWSASPTIKRLLLVLRLMAAADGFSLPDLISEPILASVCLHGVSPNAM